MEVCDGWTLAATETCVEAEWVCVASHPYLGGLPGADLLFDHCPERSRKTTAARVYDGEGL